MAKKGMTLGALRDALNQLSPAQLEQEAIWWGDDRGGIIGDVEVLKEDYASFGIGMEPWSAYADDPELTIEDADVVMKAGTPILLDVGITE